MARYRASWRENTQRLAGTLPNAWLYRCADFECATANEAQRIACDLVPRTGELIEVLDLTSGTSITAAVRDGGPQPTFTGGGVGRGAVSPPAEAIEPTASSPNGATVSRSDGAL